MPATQPGKKISSRARSYLRSLAHHLEPVVQIGNEGVTEGVVAATSTALDEHELIKLRIGQSFDGDRKEAARSLAQQTGADLVQIIGRVVVLYRPPTKTPSGGGKGESAGRPRIVLPS